MAQALPCGVCAEDKMAATYDYAVVQAAAAQNKEMVFCDVQGAVDSERLRQAAQVAGVDFMTIRTSSEPAALSFALDSKVQTLEGAVAHINDRLAGQARIVVLKGLPPASSVGTRQR
jgi:hypothetical protein